MNLHRSLLFAPASRPDLMTKAVSAAADAVLYDLEDSVPAAAKATARCNLRQALGRVPNHAAYVRINHPDADDTAQDIESLQGSRVEGVVLPKAERIADIERVCALLVDAEARGPQQNRLSIVLMIETCLGLRNAHDLLKADPRIAGVALASAEEGDFIRDLGGRWTPTGEALLYPRGKLACEARAAGIEWIIDGVFMNLADEAALLRECTIARDLGYVAKMAIHPRQLNAIHQAFTPSEEEVEYALGLIAAYREGERNGQGAVRYRGMMVDYANVRRAERILASRRPRP